MTARRFVATIFLLLPSAASAATVTVNGFTFVDQGGGVLYRGEYVNGSVTSRYDIAVLGDGFTESEQGLFDNAVSQALATLFTIPPYDNRKCAFNVWVVNLVSNDSGIDEGGTLRDTPLDCKRAVPGEPASYINGDFDKCRQACDLAGVPARNAIYVMVNSTELGAYAYQSAGITFTTRRQYTGWFLAHELAHLIAELDDEYRCRLCDGNDDGQIYFGNEPEAPNLTTVLDSSLVKWKDLLTYPEDPVPTTPEITCNCDDIGIWVGGGYHAFGIYRPAEYCLMDGTVCPENDAFCKVCASAIKDKLLWSCGWSILDSLAYKEQPGMARLMDVELLIWQEESVIQRQVKFCLSCIEPDPRLTTIVIEIPDPRDGALTIIDDLRNKVATGVVTGGDLTASFVMNPARVYYAIIAPGPPTADVLTLRARMSIDGRAVDLRP